MPRPTKWRRVETVPTVVYFKPAGVPLRLLSETVLAVEEVEAIRLKDLEGLEQEDCAERMSISRPTFHRVLKAARQKIADALMNGKAIRVEGGNFAMASQTLRCAAHGHEWEAPFDAVVSGRPLACPSCDSPAVLPVSLHGPGRGQRGPWRGGQRGGRGRGGGR